MLGRYKPSSLRGKPEKTQYFEGWFQKVYSKKHQASFILIYGYATRNTYDTFGFIQVLIPNEKPKIVYFPKHELSFDSGQHIVRMGDNCLTMNSIEISTNELDINLSLMNNHPIPTFKNSMGYHYYVPTLPCYHSVMNTSHLSEKKRCVKIKSKELELDIWITYGNKVTFKGPNQGHMSRDIFHHTDAIIGISLKQNDKTRMHRLIGNFEHIGSSFI